MCLNEKEMICDDRSAKLLWSQFEVAISVFKRIIIETEEVEVSIKSDKRSVKDKDKMLSPFTGS